MQQAIKKKGGDPNEELTSQSESFSSIPKLRGLSKDAGGRLLYRDVLVSEMLAYPITLAALLIGKSRGTIWRATARGDLHSRNGLISRVELDRYTGASTSVVTQ